jgi:hypothetical protein
MLAQFECNASGEEHCGRPRREQSEAGPWADRQASEVGGGLDPEPGCHRPDLLQEALDVWACHEVKRLLGRINRAG